MSGPEVTASSRSICALFCCSLRAVGRQTYQTRLGYHSTQASQVRLLTFLLLHLPQVISTHEGHTLWGTLCLRHPYLQLEVLLSFTEGQLLWGGCGTRCWRLEGEQALRLGWCFSWGTHLGHPVYRAHSSSRVTTAHTWVALLSGGCTVGTAAKALYACFTLAGSSSGEGGWGNTASEAGAAVPVQPLPRPITVPSNRL